MNAASTNAYHVASVIWQPYAVTAVASTEGVVAGDQCEGKYTEEPWLVNADGSHMQ
jgi:hypothetical protein